MFRYVLSLQNCPTPAPADGSPWLTTGSGCPLRFAPGTLRGAARAQARLVSTSSTQVPEMVRECEESRQSRRCR
jgi:hypothetical protein